jgi:hypothetical protein
MRKVPATKVVTTVEATESPLPPRIQEALGELVPSLSTSGETLTLMESVTPRARLELRRNAGTEYEWSWGAG